MVFSQDITVKKQYEELLDRQHDRLGGLTDFLSHDPRNPLNIVVALQGDVVTDTESTDLKTVIEIVWEGELVGGRELPVRDGGISWV